MEPDGTTQGGGSLIVAAQDLCAGVAACGCTAWGVMRASDALTLAVGVRR